MFLLSWSFQRILSLETLRERNNQQLLVKEQELQTMRQQLTAKGGEVGARSRRVSAEGELHLSLIPALKTTTVQSHCTNNKYARVGGQPVSLLAGPYQSEWHIYYP